MIELSLLDKLKCAGVAQSVEHSTLNRMVGSSILPARTKDLMGTHNIIAIRRISRENSPRVRDIWEMMIDGIPVTVEYYARMRHEPRTDISGHRNGIEYRHTIAVLKFSNKMILKHPDYKIIRNHVILTIINRYESGSI